MVSEDFFKFNKGNEFRFSNYKEIKEEDLTGADEKTKKLFNIFAGEDKILQKGEAQSLFNVLKSAAGDNQVLEDNEIKEFTKEHIGEEIDTNIFTAFVNNLFGTRDKIQNQSVSVTQNNNTNKAQETFLKEATCKEITINIIDENLSEAYEILNSQYLGSISGWYDERKDKNDILKTSNVSKVLDYQNAGIEWMNKAKIAPPNGLTKKEYYEGNKQRIKDMILTRVLVLDTSTKFKELKNKYSEKELAQIIGDYVEKLCSKASIEDLKNIQKQFVSYSGVEEIQALEIIIDEAIKSNEIKNKPVSKNEKPQIIKPKGIIPEYWNSDEPISFEEVYEIERGTEYSQYKIEQYVLAKKEMEIVANAYNKKQQFIEFAEELRNDETLSVNEKAQKVLEGFATFYALSEDGGLTQLKELIAKSKLPITIDENGFNFGALDDNAKNRTLNSLLKLAQQLKEKEFEQFLNGKTIEDYQTALAQAHDDAIGEENGKLMAEAMKNDNMTAIQRWTGNASMVGMGMTVIGGVLCFTPLAPLGGIMVTAGNTIAVTGMVAETGLGVVDYATKDVQTAEEAEQLGKNFLMNAGGFIVGIGAGKAGMKAFSNLIDEKLVAVFGKQIAAGNKAQALKTVFTNPEYLKSFMTAAGAKLSTDFVISYAGDLAMMGILDTQDDWQSLLKANLIGILVGMSGDIKDVSGVNGPRKFGVSDGVKGVNEAKLIMSNCKRNGNFNSNLFDNLINIIKQQQPANISEVKSTNIFIEKGKVYFVTVLNNGKSKKKAVSCKDINIELILGLTASRNKNGSKIFVEKATDASGVSQKIISTPNVSLKEQTKIIRDANGKPIRYEHYTESDIPGIYDIRVRDANTGETKILSTAKIDKETGNVSVIKDFESSDGTRTQYQYLDDPQGNRSFEYRIFDKDGNVLMDDRQTFTVLSENKFISTYNDKTYNIEFTENTLTVTCKNSGEKVVFILNNFIESSNKQPLLDILKQLPGHELIDLHKSTNKLTFVNDKMQSCFKHMNKELKVGSDVSVLLHEAGHGKHTFKSGSLLFEINPEIQKAYLEELDSFKKIATDRELDFIAYFIDPRQHIRKPWKDVGMIFETIAETNSLLGTYYHSPELAIRAQYLQQHFPKTIAAISNAMKNSEFLVKSFDNEPLITKKIQVGNKEKIIVDPNTEKFMYRTAVFLHQKGSTIQEAVANAMRKYGFGSDATQDLTYRTKGVQSLYDKLRNYAIDNSDKTKTHADAVNSVKDLIGTRTVTKTTDYTSHPDVKKLIEAGDTGAAVLRAAELQAEPTLQKLKNLIEKNANGNGELTIARISNYMGKDGIPYFSQRQLADLKWYAERRGVKLDFVVRAPESDPKFDQMNFSLADSKNPTKIRESGYTALQINFKTSGGQIFEWQFCGDKVNVFAEAEHVPYDLRTNKDIISGNPELAPLYEPIKTLLSKDTMREHVYNRYNEYLTDFYKHLRKLELGFQSNAPQIEDYGNYDSRLSAENLIILHDVAEKIKKAVKVEGKNSPKIQEYLNEYNALVNN